MGISRPTVLFALRAVGRNTHQVRQIGAVGCRPYLVQQFVRTTELTDRFDSRMHAERRQILLAEFHRAIGTHLNILETVVVEIGCKRLGLSAPEGIDIGLELMAGFREEIDIDITGFEASGLLEQLSVLHRYDRPAFALYVQPGYPCHVFTKVEHMYRIAERTDIDCRYFTRTDSGHNLSHEFR